MAATGYTFQEVFSVVRYLFPHCCLLRSGCILTPEVLRLWSLGLQTRAVDLLGVKQMPSDGVAQQLLSRLVELLRSDELPGLAIGGAWMRIAYFIEERPRLGHVAMELGLFELAAEHLRALGSPADAVSISRGKAGRAHAVLRLTFVLSSFARKNARTDLEGCVSSGVFDICLEMIVAVASTGVDGLQDTDHCALFFALSVLQRCSSRPECEAKIRSGAATALRFCLEHSLEAAEEIGMTTGSVAAIACCDVFGRDEGGSEFTFTPLHIKMLTEAWSQCVRAVGYYATLKPSAGYIFAAHVCVSDQNKPLLIANKDFIPYLVDALLLDPEHPRAGMKGQVKAWCQQHHCEALAQLSVHEESRLALLQDSSVMPALESVAEAGLTAEARELATAALVALRDKKLRMVVEGQKHVMLSCE